MNKETKEKTALFFSLAVMLSLATASVYVMVKVLPQYSLTYGAISQALPFLTRIFLRASVVVSSGLIFFLAALLVGAVVSLTLVFTVKKRILLTEIFALGATFFFCLIAFSFYATRLPLSQLDRDMDKQLKSENLTM